MGSLVLLKIIVWREKFWGLWGSHKIFILSLAKAPNKFRNKWWKIKPVDFACPLISSIFFFLDLQLPLFLLFHLPQLGRISVIPSLVILVTHPFEGAQFHPEGSCDNIHLRLLWQDLLGLVNHVDGQIHGLLKVWAVIDIDLVQGQGTGVKICRQDTLFGVRCTSCCQGWIYFREIASPFPYCQCSQETSKYVLKYRQIDYITRDLFDILKKTQGPKKTSISQSFWKLSWKYLKW